MMGFQFRKLKILGSDGRFAELPFDPGLNVITGPSETGKSYVLECLSYMLGIKGPPKLVPEAEPYSTILLEIVDSKGKHSVLHRDLRKAGEIRLYSGSSVDDWHIHKGWQPLRMTPQAKNSASEFFLSLSGLARRMVRVDGRDKTQKLRFEDVARFCLVDDRRITHDFPPTFPNCSKAKEIHDESVLRLLVTGQDDSLLRQIKEARVKGTLWVAKREVYSSWIAPIEQKLGWVPGSLFPAPSERATELEATLREVDAGILEHTGAIELKYAALNDHMTRRRAVWDRMSQRRARLSSLEDMSLRFGVLREQYESDLARIEFVNEGEHYLSQLGEVCCPLCGRPSHSSGLLDDAETGASLQSVRAAASGEAHKLKAHLRDLADLVGSISSERQSLLGLVAQDGQEIQHIEEHVRSEIEPRIVQGKVELDQLVHQRAELARQIEDWKHLENLRREQVALGSDPRRQRDLPKRASLLKRDFMHTLATAISKTLKAWKYAAAPHVTFDDLRVDMIVDGKARASCGKGVRALLYSAFVVSVLRHCIGAELPHLGVVVLDSPISGYKEKDVIAADTEERVSDDVATMFFHDMSDTKQYGQVIVIENSLSAAWQTKEAKHIHFTKERGEGRYGFFPV